MSIGFGIGLNYCKAILPNPSLSFDWLNTNSLTSAEGYPLTFTRASQATYWGSDGLLKWADENMYTYSEELDNPIWVKSVVSVLPNQTTAPDGTNTADSIIPIANSSAFRELRYDVNILDKTIHTFSAYVKNAGYQYIQIIGNAGVFGNGYINIDLQTGTETAFVLSNSNIINRGIVDIGNGWYRVWSTWKSIADGPGRLLVDIVSSATSVRGEVWTANGTSGIYQWGCQMNRGGLIPYYKVVSSPFYSSRFEYNASSLAKQGLKIEPQATNLILRSEDYANAYWTKVDSTAVLTTETLGIRGNTNEASKITEGTLQTSLFSSTATTITQGVNYTYSTIIKRGNFDWIRVQLANSSSDSGCMAWFNLASFSVGNTSLVGTGGLAFASVEQLSNSYCRIYVTFSINSGNSNVICRTMSATANNSLTRVDNGFYYMNGSQLELGSPTSYIQTTNTTTTRSADVATMSTGAWYNSAQGSILAEYMSNYLGATDTATVVSMNDGTDRILLRSNNGAGSQQMLVTSGGAEQANITASGVATLTAYKTALGFNANDFAIVSNNGTIATDTSGAVQTVNMLRLGSNIGTTESINGWLRSFKYYNRKLPNAQLQALTA